MVFHITNGEIDGNKIDKHAANSGQSCSAGRFWFSGFTLIELLVTLSIVALLLALAVPRYFGRIEMAKEVALKEDLHQMRDALDKFYSDNARYPENLQDLVTRKYLRRIPVDPITDSDKTWMIVSPSDPKKGRVSDVRSGAPGNAKDGTSYKSW
jgi:general secretion pathway protein G